MVLPKKTTRELIGDYIDLDIERQMVTDNEEQLEVEAQLQKVQGQIRKKVDGIDHFMLELSRREHLIDAEIEAIKSEQSRLRVRKKAVEGMKDYFNKQLLPMIVDELEPFRVAEAVKENSFDIPSPLPTACVPVVPVFPNTVYVAFTPPETVNSPAKADVAIATEEITENNSFVNLFIVSPLLKR